MRTFEFNFQNNKSGKHVGYGVLGMFAPLIIVFVLIEIFPWGSSFTVLFVASLLLGFGSLVYGIWKFHKHAKSSDRISLRNDGFDSEFHGYIAFSDIESISGFGALGAPPPSMKIRLRSGKKIAWYLSPTKTSFNTEEDAEVFKIFTVALGDRLVAYERKLTPASYENSGKLSGQAREVAKKHNRAVWAVPVGLVFAVLAFTRTCGEDYFKNKREKEVQQIFINSDIRYQQLVEESRQVLEDYVPSLGAVYLFSNDPDVAIKLLPDIPENSLLHATPVLARADQSKYLKELIRNPDSIDFLTLLIHPDQDIKAMTKSRLNSLDSTNTWLYLRFYDPERQAINTGIAIYEDQSIRESLENSMVGLRMMLAQAKHSPTFKIYLTGAEKDQVSEQLFQDVSSELQSLLHEVGVDTNTFQNQIFNPIF